MDMLLEWNDKFINEITKQQIYTNHPIYQDSQIKKPISEPYKFQIIQHKSVKSPLHYDLRLESNDKRKLLSWALVPKKGKNIDGSEMWQIETNLHPLDFLTIRGTKKYNPNDHHQFYDKGIVYKLKYSHNKIALRFKGNKINGIWLMVRVSREDKDEYQSKWIMKKSENQKSLLTNII